MEQAGKVVATPFACAGWIADEDLPDIDDVALAHTYMPFAAAKTLMVKLRIASEAQYKRDVRRGNLLDVPLNPDTFYGAAWRGWEDYLWHPVRDAEPLAWDVTDAQIEAMEDGELHVRAWRSWAAHMDLFSAPFDVNGGKDFAEPDTFIRAAAINYIRVAQAASMARKEAA